MPCIIDSILGDCENVGRGGRPDFGGFGRGVVQFAPIMYLPCQPIPRKKERDQNCEKILDAPLNYSCDFKTLLQNCANSGITRNHSKKKRQLDYDEKCIQKLLKTICGLLTPEASEKLKLSLKKNALQNEPGSGEIMSKNEIRKEKMGIKMNRNIKCTLPLLLKYCWRKALVEIISSNLSCYLKQACKEGARGGRGRLAKSLLWLMVDLTGEVEALSSPNRRVHRMMRLAAVCGAHWLVGLCEGEHHKKKTTNKEGRRFSKGKDNQKGDHADKKGQFGKGGKYDKKASIDKEINEKKKQMVKGGKLEKKEDISQSQEGRTTINEGLLRSGDTVAKKGLSEREKDSRSTLDQVKIKGKAYDHDKMEKSSPSLASLEHKSPQSKSTGSLPAGDEGTKKTAHRGGKTSSEETSKSTLSKERKEIEKLDGKEKDEKFSRQMKDDKFSRQMKDDKFSKQMKDDKFSKQMKDDKFSRQKKDKLGKNEARSTDTTSGEVSDGEDGKKEKKQKTKKGHIEIEEGALDKSIKRDEIDPLKSERETGLQKVLKSKLTEKLEGEEVNEKEVSEMSQKMGAWMNQQLTSAEKDLEKLKLGSLVIHLKEGGRDYYRVKQIGMDIAEEKTLQARSLTGNTRGGVVPQGSSSSSPQELQEWAKWVLDVIEFSEKWVKWIDRNVKEAEEQVQKAQGRLPQQSSDIDRWNKLLRNIQDESNDWRRSSKSIKTTADSWAKKFPNK